MRYFSHRWKAIISCNTELTLLTVHWNWMTGIPSQYNETKPALTVLYCLVSPTVGMLGPRNLRVSDEYYTRFRVSWDPAPSRVNGYKLIYQPEGMDLSLWGHKLHFQDTFGEFLYLFCIFVFFRLWWVLWGACWRRHLPSAPQFETWNHLWPEGAGTVQHRPERSSDWTRHHM